MNVSLNLAQFYANEGVNLKDIAHDELLTKIGAQLGAVEAATDWAPRFDGVVVVKVVGCEKHPNADKLHVCLVDDGGVVENAQRNDQGLVQVVCGAPNVRDGMFVAWLAPGVTVPSTAFTADPFVLEARELRGVVSNGMLASAKELGISDDHDGILEIDPKEVGREPKVGEPLLNFFSLDDFVVDCENKMFTHRPDCFGNLGVARELAGITGQKFVSPEWYLNEPAFDMQGKVDINIYNNAEDVVKRFTAVVMSDVKITKSPIWLQSALMRLGYRPINNVVDVTNFVMHLTGQPLHAFDYDKLKMHSSDPVLRLFPRRAKGDEVIKLLNGKLVNLEAGDIVISTDTEAVALAGIMGGADTEVDENTKNIVIECATFDMYAVRRTSMRLGVFTDAVTRFSKGQSYYQNARVLSFAMQHMSELAGAKQASEVFDIKSFGADENDRLLRVKTEFVNSRLGSSLSSEEIAGLLERVEFGVSVDEGGVFEVKVPFWRMDIELAEDIVEEIGRLYGYDRLPVELPKRPAKAVAKNVSREVKRQLRQALSGAGANEILSYSFVHERTLQKAGQDVSMAYHLRNALSPDLQHYRLSLIPSILERVQPNVKAGHDSFVLYEFGKVHNNKLVEDDGLPSELGRLAAVYVSNTKGGQTDGAVYYDARNYLEYVLSSLGIDDYELRGCEQNEYSEHPGFAQLLAPFEPARTALVYISGDLAGALGEFRTSVEKGFKLPKRCAGFELFMSRLVKHGNPASRYIQLSRFPRIEQDICLKVDSAISYQKVRDLVEKELRIAAPAQTRIIISPIDIYSRGDDQGYKQITFRVSIAHYERTLTDAEVNTLLDSVAEKAHQEVGAERI